MTKFAGNMAALMLLTMMVILQTSSAAFHCDSVNRAVAFTVQYSSDDSNKGVTIIPLEKLKFDYVITNIGGGYDFNTGIFTAPVAGTYVFYLRVMSPNARGPVDITIEKHGSELGRGFAEGSSDREDQGSTHVATHLTTGEQVWVRPYYGDAVRGGPWTVFTGYLISPD